MIPAEAGGETGFDFAEDEQEPMSVRQGAKFFKITSAWLDHADILEHGLGSLALAATVFRERDELARGNWRVPTGSRFPCDCVFRHKTAPVAPAAPAA